MFVFCFRCAALYEDREDFLHYQNARASRNRRSPRPRIASSSKMEVGCCLLEGFRLPRHLGNYIDVGSTTSPVFMLM